MSPFPFNSNPANPENQFAERLESLKAGIVGKLTAAILFVPLTLLNHFLRSGHLPQSGTLKGLASWLQLETLISGAIVLLSGFLFGITYRYIVRLDSNPQLQSGAVGAFGLVRGLAQIEANWDKKMPLWIGGLEVAENLLLFGAIALSLNWAMHRGWIQRMK